MALPVNIDDLINHRKVECARIEYKEGWNPEKVLHTLCAFANDLDNWGGGYVILGVEEKNGKPVFPVKGLSEGSIDHIQKELLGICHLIEPLYLPVVEPVEYQGKMLLKSDAETVRELNMADPVEGVNEGVNEGVKILLAAIRKNPGKRTNELALLIGKSVQTVERYVKELKAAGDVEFRGAPKNGGYFIIDNEGR